MSSTLIVFILLLGFFDGMAFGILDNIYSAYFREYNFYHIW